MVNFDKLRRFHKRGPRLVPTNLNTLPLLPRDGEDFYEIEQFSDHCSRPNVPREFFVKLKGYDASHNAWEPEQRRRADVALPTRTSQRLLRFGYLALHFAKARGTMAGKFAAGRGLVIPPGAGCATHP